MTENGKIFSKITDDAAGCTILTPPAREPLHPEVLTNLLRPPEKERCRLFFGLSGGIALCHVCLAQVQQLAAGDELPLRAYLTAAEWQRFSSFSRPKRRREWLGGRLAAKQAAQALLLPAAEAISWQEWRIDSTPAGRPRLGARPPAAGDGRCRISITHQAGLAAALAAPAPCGLDLQQPQPAVVAVRDRFSTRTERLRLDIPAEGEAQTLELLTLLWAAKEATRKGIPCTPLAGFLELELLEVDGCLEQGLRLQIRHRRGDQVKIIPVAAFVKHGYCCALTVIT